LTETLADHCNDNLYTLVR